MGNITYACSNVLENSEGTTWKTCAYMEHKKIHFMAAPCINNIKHFIVQLMYTTYKILILLK